MDDIFSKAAAFFPKQDDKNPERKLLLKEVRTILKTAEFMTAGERQKIESILPIMDNTIVKSIKDELIAKNLKHLQQKLNNNQNAGRKTRQTAAGNS